MVCACFGWACPFPISGRFLCYADCNPQPDTDAHAYKNADFYTNTNLYPNQYGYAHTDLYLYAKPNLYLYAYDNLYPYKHSNFNGNSNFYSKPDCNEHLHVDAD